MKRRVGNESGSSGTTGAPTVPPVPGALGSVNISQTVAPRLSEELGESPTEPAPPVDLPALKDVPIGERVELAIRKLRSVETLCDFQTPTAQVSEKEKKKQTLAELVDFISTSSSLKPFSHEGFLVALFRAASANLFRPLPVRGSSGFGAGGAGGGAGAGEGGEEDEPVLEPSWVHLQQVYELLLRTIVSNDLDAKTSKSYLSQNFIAGLVGLFKSEDPRERDYLKTLLHRIYGKYMVYRSFVRRLMQDFFLAVAYERDVGVGVAELLEILGSIINGFALPLKEEHKIYLAKVLLPLHKSRQLGLFHQQLLYCVTQYIEKDGKLAGVVVGGLIRLWPRENSNKEVLFIHELEEVLDLTPVSEFKQFAPAVVNKLARLVTSSNFQVAERALFIWNNETVPQVLFSAKDILYPVLVPVLLDNVKRHWNGSVHALTCNVLKILTEHDPVLYAAASVGPLLPLGREVEPEALTKWELVRQSADREIDVSHDISSVASSAEASLPLLCTPEPVAQ